MPGHGDWLICGISTQLQHFIKDFDEMLDQKHPDFRSSRLQTPSIVRLGFLTVVPSFAIPGAIGNLSQATVKKLTGNLVRHLKL